MSAIGTNRTSACALHMSAFDPKRTLADDGTQRPLSHEVEITTCSADGPSGHASSDDPNPTTTVQASPAVTPAASPPLHVRGSRGRRWRPRKREIGAAWVGPDPPAKIRPAIPIANTVRDICVLPNGCLALHRG